MFRPRIFFQLSAVISPYLPGDQVVFTLKYTRYKNSRITPSLFSVKYLNMDIF